MVFEKTYPRVRRRVDPLVAEGPEVSCALAGFHSLTEVGVDAEIMSHGVLPPIVAGVVVRVICPRTIKIKRSNLHLKVK